MFDIVRALPALLLAAAVSADGFYGQYGYNYGARPGFVAGSFDRGVIVRGPAAVIKQGPRFAGVAASPFGMWIANQENQEGAEGKTRVSSSIEIFRYVVLPQEGLLQRLPQEGLLWRSQERLLQRLSQEGLLR